MHDLSRLGPTYPTSQRFTSGCRPHDGAGPAAAVSPARAVAYAVVRRVFEQEAWADRALHGEARRAGLDARDRALATQLAYGVVQRAATLDHLIAVLARRPVARLEPAVLAALRLGVFQLAFLDGVAAHAAVGESVELAKADAPRGAGPRERRAAARRARGARARRGAPRPHGRRGGRAPLASRAGSPSCGSTRSGRTPRAR